MSTHTSLNSLYPPLIPLSTTTTTPSTTTATSTTPASSGSSSPTPSSSISNIPQNAPHYLHSQSPPKYTIASPARSAKFTPTKRPTPPSVCNKRSLSISSSIPAKSVSAALSREIDIESVQSPTFPFAFASGFILPCTSNKWTAKMWIRFSVCFLVVFSLAVATAVLLFWKIFLPTMIQNAFSATDLTGSNDPLLGITLFDISNFNDGGLTASIAMRKTGLVSTVPLTFAQNSLWQVQVCSPAFESSAWSTPQWYPLLQIPSLPSSLNVRDGVLTFMANDTDIQVLNSTLLGKSISMLVQNTTSVGMYVKVVVVADVVVGNVFWVPKLELQNVISMNPYGSNDASNDGARQAPFFGNFTAKAAKSHSNGVIETALDIDLQYEVAGKQTGSPFAFPGISNVTVWTSLNGLPIAMIQVSEISLELHQRVLHIPVNVTLTRAASDTANKLAQQINQAVNATKQPSFNSITGTLGSLLSSATKQLSSKMDVVLSGWNVGGIEGEARVPVWMQEVVMMQRVSVLKESQDASSDILIALMEEIVGASR